jgi:hypothetical protein
MNLTLRYGRRRLEIRSCPTGCDKEICTFAIEHEYVVLPNDLNFPQILACQVWQNSLDPEKTGEIACPTTKDQQLETGCDRH